MGSMVVENRADAVAYFFHMFSQHFTFERAGHHKLVQIQDLHDNYYGDLRSFSPSFHLDQSHDSHPFQLNFSRQLESSH